MKISTYALSAFAVLATLGAVACTGATGSDEVTKFPGTYAVTNRDDGEVDVTPGTNDAAEQKSSDENASGLAPQQLKKVKVITWCCTGCRAVSNGGQICDSCVEC